MSIFDILTLVCGLSLFLYGMHVMGDALKKSAGSKLKVFLSKMTSNPIKGFLLGSIVTAVIQSSSATTVMVVGFVNSEAMTLTQAVGVIIGANVGTAVTAWITGLSGIGNGADELSTALNFLKPSAWMPILAFIGIALLMFSKKDVKKNIGVVLLGFAVLMIGMDYMSSSVSGLESSPSFRSILTMFENPLLGVLSGTLLSAIVQSSSASVGIFQSLTTTGAVTYGTAFPIIMGLNIGACVPVLLSSIGSTKNGKRAAMIYLYFNIIGAAVFMGGYYLLDIFIDYPFAGAKIGTIGVAVVHSIFKLVSALAILPFYKSLETLAKLTIREKKTDAEKTLLDERLLTTPSIAVEQAGIVAKDMAILSRDVLKRSLKLLEKYDEQEAHEIDVYESVVDKYEDALGTYLVKLSSRSVSESDSREVTKILHVIGDLERISDHAVNISRSAAEINEKQVHFSEEALHEMHVLASAINEILDIAINAFVSNDVEAASLVEPLEQTVDYLKNQIKLNHILRLQKNECSMEHGFVLSDIITNCERVADHCSNIAGCVIEIMRYDALDVHKYLEEVKTSHGEFEEKYKEYRRKYAL